MLEALVTTDQILGPARKAIGALAIGGLIASGLYLRHSSAGGLFPYAAMRGLHWLLGLIVVIDALWRLLRLAKRGRGLRASITHGKWPFHPVPGSPVVYGLVAVGYWTILIVVVVTGIAAFMESRYGLSINWGIVPLAWAKLHSLAFFYLPFFLLLRLFYWSRTYLKEVLPYLRRP